jgi:hypothetical protein
MANPACKLAADAKPTRALPPAIQARIEPVEVTVKSGGAATVDVVLVNTGGAVASLVLVRPFALDFPADAHDPIAGSAPPNAVGFKAAIADMRGRRVDAPEGGGAAIFGDDAGGATRIELEPGASVRAKVTFQAAGYDPEQDFKRTRHGSAEGHALGPPKPLLPGRYLVEVPITTLDAAARTSAAARLTVTP